MSNSFSSTNNDTSNNMTMKKLKSTSLAAELNKVQSGDDCNCQHAASVQSKCTPKIKLKKGLGK